MSEQIKQRETRTKLVNEDILPQRQINESTFPTICRKCIMDSEVPGIEFDESGVCSCCHLHDRLEQEHPLNESGRRRLEQLIDEIRESGRSNKYDCIVGVSGGTDSTYTLYITKKLGLRPLAVHFDNGWNTSVAVRNIYNVLSTLNVDLFTYVVDWEEFKDLQLSFLKASVPDAETPTDMGIRGCLYKVASTKRIKYIISGNSFRTEGVVPHGWGYKDGRYISGVQRIFGEKKLRTFPNLTLTKYLYYSLYKRLKIVRLLNFFEYSKEEAKKTLSRELGWRDYGGHHHESIYTRFFQSYLAPRKFNMDRRKIALSAQVRAGELSRSQALRKLEKEDPYPSYLIKDDMKYISKKLGISLEEFEEIINRAPSRFLDYPTYYPLIRRSESIINFAHKVGLLPNIFQGGKFSG